MSFIYHIVPQDFHADILYPLTALREKSPADYELHAKKYEARKHITELYIPQLDCYWGDVIHFAAINPDTLVAALKEAGFEEHFSYFEIDTARLDSANTIIYTNAVKEDKHHLTEADFVAFSDETLKDWAFIPEETKAYYRKKATEGKKPIPFLFVPHILYKGSVNLKGLELKHTV